MTGTIDHAVVDVKLRDLAHRLRRVGEKKPASARALASDADLQDILARNLTLAIQVSIDIAFHVCAARGVLPATAAEAFVQLAGLGLIPQPLAERLVLAVGFRNILIHEYAEVDWKIVMRVIRSGTGDLAAFGKAMVALLDADD